MKRTIINIMLTLALLMAGVENTRALNQQINITVGGRTRSYRLYVPKNCPANAPLVIAMHGTGGSMDNEQPSFNDIASTEKFIVAYPQGDNIYFPVFGATLPGWRSTGEYNEDADFLKAIIDDLTDKYQIDRNRCYCCGFSNGGMNTYAMANACSDVFAAFASISGFPLNEFHLRHVGKRPVPFLHIHGKGDDFVKYSLMPVIVDQMVARNGANPVPVRTSVKGKYDKSVYEATDGSFPYIYYEVDDMGHEPYTSNTEDGSSSLTMWRFFKQYTLDMPCDATLKWMPRIEEEGFNIKEHGWKKNLSKTLLSFGQGASTDENQNVYNALQFTTGHYKLCFKSQGEAGKTFTVKLTRYPNNTVVLNTTVNVGEDTTLNFDIDDDFGEYRLLFTRQNSADDITITGIAIYSADDDPSAISTVTATRQADTMFYTLSGLPATHPTKGLYINAGKKVVIK